MAKIDSVSLEEKFVEVEGIKTQYFTGGTGQSLLLIHGWPLAFHIPSPFLDNFAYHFKVFAINLPGFGKSGKLIFPPTVESYNKFLNNFVKTLKIGKHLVIGWSFGGLLTIKHATSQPENITKIVLCATAASGDEIAPGFQPVYKILSSVYEKIPFANRFFERILKDKKALVWAWEKISPNDPGKKSSISAAKKFSTAFNKALFDAALKVDLKKNCRRLKEIPTLIIAGEKDSLMTKEASKEIDKLIGTSHFLIVPDSMHGDVLNQDSLGIVIDFLKSKRKIV